MKTDWEAAYEDIERTREDARRARLERRDEPGVGHEATGVPGAGGAFEADSSDGGGGDDDDDFRVVAASGAAFHSPSPRDDDAAATPGGPGGGAGAVTESRASPGAELVGDLYEKLAALGARDVGALLTQSPTVKRQLARMRAASEERDDA